jgi:hypothetical protein
MTKCDPQLSVVKAGSTQPQPPRHLGHHGMSLWSKVLSEFVIVDAGGIETLCQCCQALDRAEAIAAEIVKDGLVIRTARGARSHPSIKEELMNRSFVVRTLERLGITLEPLNAQPGRQPVGRGAGITFLPPQRGE